MLYLFSFTCRENTLIVEDFLNLVLSSLGGLGLGLSLNSSPTLIEEDVLNSMFLRFLRA